MPPRRSVGGSRVGAAKELEQHGVRIGRGADGLIRQDELAQCLVEAGGVASHRVGPVAVGFGIGVGVEDTFAVGAGPVAGAADLVRVGLVHHVRPAVRCAAGMRRSGATREPCHGEIERTPEQVDGTHLADELGTDLLEDPLHLDEGSPVVNASVEKTAAALRRQSSGRGR